MVRSVFAAALAVALSAGPVMALAQTTDMVTYADTMRKKSASHSAIRPVARGPVSGKHAASSKHSAKHAVSAKKASGKHASAKPASKGKHRK